MKDAGIYGTTSAAAEQSRTAYVVMASLPDIRQSIRKPKRPLPDVAPTGTEHRTRCTGRATAAYGIFSRYPLAVAIQLSDVKAAEMSLGRQLLYNTNSARAAFYPQITLSGSGG